VSFIGGTSIWPKSVLRDRLVGIGVLLCLAGWARAQSSGEGAQAVATDGGTSASDDPERATATPIAEADAGVRQVESGREAGRCAAEEENLQSRRSWLSKRFVDQQKRGVANPAMGIPNMTGVYCEQHPQDSQCTAPNQAIEYHPDELSIDAQKSPEDRDSQVILLKRELNACRKRFR
jgi:hypothetical protein